MMKRRSQIIYLLLSFLVLCSLTTNAQDGDQILDGIGETGLISRYSFNGDAKDWSRNNWHANIQGDDFKFLNDELFGKVLSFNGNNQTFISLPANSLAGEEMISVTGWI